MKLLQNIKAGLATITDHLATAATHVPPITHVTLSNPQTGAAVTLTPASPITLVPAPKLCPHCGK